MSEEMELRLLEARRVIIGVTNTQRSEMSDLAVIALQDVALELGDIVFNSRNIRLSRYPDNVQGETK